MKYHIIAITLVLLFPACTSMTPQQSALASGIADIAIGAAAAHFGLPASDTQVITTAVNSLWGSATQAQASQPVAAGASVPAVGAAIAAGTPTGSPNATAALLQVAATLAQSGLK